MKKKVFALLISLFVLCGLITLPVPSSAAETLTTMQTLENGGTYTFVYDGSINDNESKYSKCVLMSVQSADPHGLAYKQMEAGSPADDCTWVLESAGSGNYYLKSKATGKYLNMKPSTDGNGKGYATMESAPQALTVVNNGGKFKITATLEGTTYYIRFTNSYKSKGSVSCWEAATADGSNVFIAYGIKSIDLSEYNNTTEPLFSVACFSDLHVDYGIQSYAKPVRPGTIKAANYVKNTLGAADVALIGGDITSNNGNNSWTKVLIEKTQKTVYDTVANATKDGKVLVVSGNHENEAGVIAKDGYSSGDYSDLMNENVGEFKETLYFNEMGAGNSTYNELMCYRYEVGNIEFIGINTPYRTERSGGYTYLEQIEWVEEQLEDIGKEETVIIFCHYPLESIVDAPGQTGAKAALTAVLNKYPNVLYCYGHVHGGSQYYAWYTSSELVVPQNGATKLANNAYQTNSFINVHMGSMGYYKTQYAPDSWLGEAEPVINQLLTIDFYEDHITFEYHNTGAKTAVDGVTDIASYTIMRDMSAQLKGDSDGPSTSTDNVDATSSATVSDSEIESDTGSVTDTVSDSDTVSDTETDSETTETVSAPSNDEGEDPSSDGGDKDGEDASDGLPVIAIVLLVGGGVILLGGLGLGAWYFLVFSKKK